jgi:WD40 repeat protein
MRLWNLRTGRELRVFQGHTHSIWGVSFSADGRRALSGSFDRSARVWDTATGRELAQFTAGDQVWAVAFSPDGHRVAAAGDDKDIIVWSLPP